MKALIRNKYETIRERGQSYIDWTTGAPLTNPAWAGGPYQLVQNYVPSQEDAPESYEEIVVEPEQVEDENDYVIIDGKRYSKKELRSLLE